MYASLDRGASWRRFMESMPAVPVHDLRIHPRDRELIAGTHGRSIWIVNIAPLQDLTMQVLADGAGAFEPAPAYGFAEAARGGESYGQAWFARPTPGVGGRISYYIGDDVAEELVAAAEAEDDDDDEEAPAEAEAQVRLRAARAGRPLPGGADPGAGWRGRWSRWRAGRAERSPVEITITDADGEVVQTLNGPAGAGLHTVNWNLRRATEPEPQDAVSVRAARQHHDRGAREGGSRFAGGGGAGGGASPRPARDLHGRREPVPGRDGLVVGAGGSVVGEEEATIRKASWRDRVNRRRARVVGVAGGAGAAGSVART